MDILSSSAIVEKPRRWRRGGRHRRVDSDAASCASGHTYRSAFPPVVRSRAWSVVPSPSLIRLSSKNTPCAGPRKPRTYPNTSTLAGAARKQARVGVVPMSCGANETPSRTPSTPPSAWPLTSESSWSFTKRSSPTAGLRLCGNQISDAPRHRRVHFHTGRRHDQATVCFVVAHAA